MSGEVRRRGPVAAWPCAALAVLVALASSCAVSSRSLGSLSASMPPDDALPYDRWRQKSVHNAYDRLEPLDEQLAVHGFRSLEIDVHRTKLGRGAEDADWWVYHHALDALATPSCSTLSECLERIDAFHRSEPGHDALTVFVDLKDDFDEASHRSRDLDARLRAALAPGALFEPQDLRARCPGATRLRDAVAGRCTWPSLGELRGRVLVVLTGGDLCASASRLGTYLGDAAGPHAAFVAPRVDAHCGFEAQARSGQVLFFNLDRDAFSEARAIGRAHLVSRGFAGGLQGGIDDPELWLEALDAGVNILATDRIDAEGHPWTNALAPRVMVEAPAATRRAIAGR